MLRRVAAVTGAFAAFSGAAFAQNTPAPSQVQPPVIRPAPATTRIAVPQIPAGATLPESAKTLRFVLTALDVEGEFAELAGARRELESGLIGKRITVADLFELANKLQQIYVRAGYPLARIVILPQELDKRARARLRVVDGYIERIDDTAIAQPVARRVSAVLFPLIGRRRLTQGELERQLLIAGEAPGLVLNAVFAGGKDVGGSILILTGRYRPVSASIYVDNAMPKSFGTLQAVTNVSFNSLLGLGEQFSVSAAGFPDRDYVTSFPTRRYLGATLAVPLGIDGWRFEFGATDGRTTPRVDPVVATLGRFRQARARLAYDLIKRRDVQLTFSARFDATDESVDALLTSPPTPLSLDRVRALRAGVDGIWRMRETGTTISYAGTFSHGLNALGARTAADATPLLPLSRHGADATFDKLDGRVDVLQALPQDFYLSLGVAAQTSFNKPLLTSEQLGIVGANMLSGFTAGALAGDNAWVVRGEAGHSSTFAMNEIAVTLSPYVFAATGERRYEMPTVLEAASIHATNYGVGLRVQTSSESEWLPGVSGFVEYSRRSASDPNLEGWRVFAGAALRY
jgi:hemolysin activation/secretion protein